MVFVFAIKLTLCGHRFEFLRLNFLRHHQQVAVPLFGHLLQALHLHDPNRQFLHVLVPVTDLEFKRSFVCEFHLFSFISYVRDFYFTFIF